MKLTITLEGRPPIELDVPTATTPPDRSKLVEAMRAAKRRWNDESDSRSFYEMLADAALAHFAESAPVQALDVEACAEEISRLVEQSLPFDAEAILRAHLKSPAPVRNVVPDAVRAFVDGWGQRGPHEHALHAAARAAIDSLDKGSEPEPSISRAAVPESVATFFGRGHNVGGPTGGTSWRADRPTSLTIHFTNQKAAQCASSWLDRARRDVEALDSGSMVLVERGELERLRAAEMEALQLAGDAQSERCAEVLKREAAERRASDAELRAASLQDMNEWYLAANAEIERLKKLVQAGADGTVHGLEKADEFLKRATAAEAKLASVEKERDEKASESMTHMSNSLEWRRQRNEAIAERDAALKRHNADACVFNGYPFETWIKVQRALYATTALHDPLEAVERLIDVKDAALKREVVLPKRPAGLCWPFQRDEEIKSANPGVAFKEPTA